MGCEAGTQSRQVGSQGDVSEGQILYAETVWGTCSHLVESIHEVVVKVLRKEPNKS